MRIAAAVIIGLAVALLIAIIAAQHAGHRADESKRNEKAAKAEVVALKADLKTEAGKERILIRYVDRVQQVRTAGATIVKEVPRYVTVEADRACVVPVGFVQLHDAAAAGVPPAAPGAGNPDAPARGLALSAVAETVAGNYTACHETSEQLIALQDYVRLTQAGSVE
jgi:hypothetical protein